MFCIIHDNNIIVVYDIFQFLLWNMVYHNKNDVTSHDIIVDEVTQFFI